MTTLPAGFFDRPLAEVDPEVADALQGELERQRTTLEMIASENFVPRAVLECQGSVATNKYADGYPGHRYYAGCEFVDVAERLAIDRAKAVFGGEHVNVQPHSGSQANAAVYHALLQPGDRVMGLAHDHGGHVTHGAEINVSGRLYEAHAYGVREETGVIDMDDVAALASRVKPKLIVAGWSVYPRQLNFEEFATIARDVGALLLVDMAHFAGLVAAGLHPNPVPHADVVTTTIHKTIGGARGGMVICRAEHAEQIDEAVFPGQQGGPLEHVIAGKAVALHIAQSDEFRERQRRCLDGARAIGEELLAADHGVGVWSGGTDVHLVVADLRHSELDGKVAQDRLEQVGITANRSTVPFDPRPPAVRSGLRIGTSALATRGLEVDEFRELGAVIRAVLGPGFDAECDALSRRCAEIAGRHPLYSGLGYRGESPAR